MTDKNRLRIESLFHEAFDLSPGERQAFLHEAAGNDKKLRREVEALLAAADRQSPLPDRPAVLSASKLFDFFRENGLDAGRVIGPYKTIRLIGQGGMGTVYLAERADRAFQRKVAIKLIKRGMDSEAVVRRFQQERQLLANLDHPCIAKLLDGGTAENGLPYLVMEYIQGEPIDSYCDNLELDIRRRLDLFRKVCSAVHCAHRNLIVHRDLKPGNIMVTPEGLPKLLDFGIAKILAPAQAGEAVTSTQNPLQVMTIDYASPEQIQGKPITTAGDIYSLGVVLYRILTGRLPFELKDLSRRETERMICEEKPCRPSSAVLQAREKPASHGSALRRTTPLKAGRLRRQLAGDLDTILLAALRKEPERRYASAERFSEDLGRFLAGLPVTARKDTLGYRTLKFVKRNKTGVFAALLVLATLVLGLVGTSWQARKARQSEARTLSLAKICSQINDEAVDLLKQGDYKGAALRIRDLLKMRRRLFGDDDLAVAQSMNNLGFALSRMGKYQEALSLYHQALKIRKDRLGAHHEKVAITLNNLALTEQELGHYETAERLCRESLQIRKKVLGPEDPNIFRCVSNLAGILEDQGRLDEAESLCRQVLSFRKRTLGGEHTDVAAMLNRLGALLSAKRDFESAEPLLREALALQKKLLHSGHPDITSAMNNLALCLRQQGRLDEAEPFYHEVLKMRRKTLGDRHPGTALTLHNLAWLLVLKGGHEEARPLCGEARDIRREMLPSDHPDIAESDFLLGVVFLGLGEPAAAEPMLAAGLEGRKKTRGPDDLYTGQAMIELAEALFRQRKYEKAETLFERGQEIIITALGPDHDHSVKVGRQIADFYAQWGRPEGKASHENPR